MNLPALPKPGAAVAAHRVEEIEQLVAESVAAIDDLDLLDDWRAQARALEAYLRGKELQRPILGAQRRIEARIGQILGEPSHAPGSVTHAEHLERRADRHDFRLLARALDGDCPLGLEEWRKSRRALVSLVRQRLGVLPQTPDLPSGTYQCVVADPPWVLDTGPDTFGGTGEAGHDDLAYSQMSLEAIKSLEVESIAADDAHLYLWTTDRYLRDAYDVAAAWGFRKSVVLVWAKNPRGIGLGDTYRLTTEFVLFCRRGSLEHRRVIPTTWFNWPRGRHSAKPAEFYDMVESVTPGPYVDLFARTARPGWDVWGAEAPEDVA